MLERRWSMQMQWVSDVSRRWYYKTNRLRKWEFVHMQEEESSIHTRLQQQRIETRRKEMHQSIRHKGNSDNKKTKRDTCTQWVCDMMHAALDEQKARITNAKMTIGDMGHTRRLMLCESRPWIHVLSPRHCIFFALYNGLSPSQYPN